MRSADFKVAARRIPTKWYGLELANYVRAVAWTSVLIGLAPLIIAIEISGLSRLATFLERTTAALLAGLLFAGFSLVAFGLKWGISRRMRLLVERGMREEFSASDGGLQVRIARPTNLDLCLPLLMTIVLWGMISLS